MMQYDAFLFDLYGTLIDIHTDLSLPSAWKQLAAHLSAQGADWTARALKDLYRTEVRRLEEQSPAAFPEIDLYPVFSEFYTRRGIRPDPDQIAQAAWLFRRASASHIRLYAGAKELLGALKKRGKVILLSNAQRLFTMPELQQFDLLDAFDAIYLSSDYGCKKPDPAFFRLPLAEYSLDPARCLMIGNDPDCDVSGAAQAGMDAYYIRSAISPKDAPPSLPCRFSQPRMDLAHVRTVLCRKDF